MVVQEQTDLVQAARALAPTIERYRDQSERERAMPQPLVDAIREAGLFRAWTPGVLGGLEVDLLAGLRAVEEVSRADGAAGWTTFIGMGGGAFLGFMPEDAAREVAGEGARHVGAGAFAPKGVATPVDGGYRVTGRWQLASGCRHAAWHGGGCIIMDGDKPRMGADGIPDITFMFWPASESEIIDTWHSAGLRGTGSHDLAVRDVFVPEGRHVSLLNAKGQQTGALYRGDLLTIAGYAIGAVALGIARGAVDAFVELSTGGKTPTFSMTRLMDRPTVHANLAHAEALLRSARAYYYETAHAVWDDLVAGRELSEERQANYRLSLLTTATNAAHVADMMFTAGGASSIYATSKIERCFRDAHCVTQHITVSPVWWEKTGQYFLGLGMGRP